MANPKLSVIPTREELGTSVNALMALLKGNKKPPMEAQNKLLIMIGDEPDPEKKKMMDEMMRKHMMKMR